jgi:hypothetical protein
VVVPANLLKSGNHVLLGQLHPHVQCINHQHDILRLKGADV